MDDDDDDEPQQKQRPNVKTHWIIEFIVVMKDKKWKWKIYTGFYRLFCAKYIGNR